MKLEEYREAEKFLEFDGHRRVVRFEDVDSGLRGFIAIHNNNLGSAVGGTRMFSYQSEGEALKDVFRLSRAMTYKCAAVGVPHGGGKGVIIGDPATQKTPELLRMYAKVIKELNGVFYTGEDVGLSEADVQLMLAEAPFFIGRAGQAGDPSPYAALSAFGAMETVLRWRWGKIAWPSRTVAIKGVGKVGGELACLLVEAGARVVVADINPQAVEKITSRFTGARAVDATEIHKISADVYAPCALGNEFTNVTVSEIAAPIICGGANNQLADGAAGGWLFNHNKVYVPDYIANAGGLIDVVDELEPGGYQRQRVLERIEKVKITVEEILELSRRQNQPPNAVADQLAERVFQPADAVQNVLVNL